MMERNPVLEESSGPEGNPVLEEGSVLEKSSGLERNPVLEGGPVCCAQQTGVHRIFGRNCLIYLRPPCRLGPSCHLGPAQPNPQPLYN